MAEAPGLVEANLLLGSLLARADRWADARRAFAAVVREAPASPEATVAQLELDRLEVVAAAQANPAAYRMLRYEALLVETQRDARAGRTAGLEWDARRAEAIDGARWEVPALAGAALGRAGRFEPCRALLAAAAERAPAAERPALEEGAAGCGQEARRSAERERGLAAHLAGRHEEAVEALERARGLAPERREDLLALAASLAEVGRFTDALAALDAIDPAQDPAAAAVRAKLRPVYSERAEAERGLELAATFQLQVPGLEDLLGPALARAEAARQAGEAARQEAVQASARHLQRIADLKSDLLDARQSHANALAAARDDEERAQEAAEEAARQPSTGNALVDAIGRGGGLALAIKFRSDAREERNKASELEAKIRRMGRELASLGGSEDPDDVAAIEPPRREVSFADAFKSAWRQAQPEFLRQQQETQRQLQQALDVARQARAPDHGARSGSPGARAAIPPPNAATAPRLPLPPPTGPVGGMGDAPPSTPSPRLVAPSASTVSGGGAEPLAAAPAPACTDMTPCVSGENVIHRGLGHFCTQSEMNGFFKNGCGQDVDCTVAVKVGGQVQGAVFVTTVKAWQRVGGQEGGIWTCNQPENATWAFKCVAKGEPSSCRQLK